MFKIHGLHTPMFIKTVLAAEEMGVPYEVNTIDLKKGEQKTPEHLNRHPFGKVPALEHNGQFLFESNTIMRYMGDVANSPFYPKGSYERAVVDQWVDYFSMQAGRWATSIWYQKCIAEKFFNEPADQKVIAESSTALLEVMPTIDAHLAKNKWLAGDNVSLADVNAYVLMRCGRDAGINFSDYRNFMRWMNDYEARPAVESTKQWWA